MRGTPDPADDIDDDDDDDHYEFSFWPSEEEFKDLLLDESRMRVEIVGDWMTPFGTSLLSMLLLPSLLLSDTVLHTIRYWQ